MKPNFNNSYYKNDDDEGAVAFTVETDPAIMKRLSNDNYQRPIEAIIRELGTNAYDSHVDNKNENTPFFVSLPTQTDLSFSTRDYGTGLSKEDLKSIYTSYGKSTRRNSNDHVGSIGIGSKSPFAYTNQFQVISIHNGIKISAICYKDEMQMPHMQIVGEEPSNEDTGIEVSFPVKDTDIAKFNKGASTVYQWFAVQPKSNVTIDYSCGVKSNIVLEEENQWSLAKRCIDQKPRVLMGNVLYSTDFMSEIPNLIIHANIGDVDINMSRESIQSNAKNQKFVKKKTKEIAIKIADKARLEMDLEPLRYKKIGIASKFISNTRGTLIPELGEAYKSYIHLGMDNTVQDIHKFSDNGNRTSVITKDDFDVPIMHADIKTGFLLACQEYFANSKEQRITLVRDDIKSFCNATDFPQSKILKASTFYNRKKIKARARLTQSVFRFNQNRGGIDVNKNSSFWHKDNVLLTHPSKTTVYVEIKNWKIESPIFNYDNIRYVISSDEISILGVKSNKKQEFIKNNPSIKSLEDHLAINGPSQDAVEFYRKHIFTTDYTQKIPGVFNIPIIDLCKRLPAKYRHRLISISEQKIFDDWHDLDTLDRYGRSINAQKALIIGKYIKDSDWKPFKGVYRQMFASCQSRYDNSEALKILNDPYNIHRHSKFLFDAEDIIKNIQP